MENQFKGSPGPWKWDGDVCNYNSLTEAPWLRVDNRFMDLVLSGEIKCKNPADAQFISASPDMYEALIGLLDFPEEDLNEWANGVEPITITILPVHIKIALLAINKALGK